MQLRPRAPPLPPRVGRGGKSACRAALSSLDGQLLLAKLIAETTALGIGAINKLTVTKTLAAWSARGRFAR